MLVSINQVSADLLQHAGVRIFVSVLITVVLKSHTLFALRRVCCVCAQIENETVLWSDKPMMLEKLSSLVQSDVGAFSLRNYFLECQVKFVESAISYF